MDKTLLSLLILAALLISALVPTTVVHLGSIVALALLVTRGSWAILQAFTIREQRVPETIDLYD
ncbi:MAG: hypothetical protein ACTS2F_30175 [Thainema sp.]